MANNDTARIKALKNKFFELYQWAWKYEISIQLWPEQNTIYIAKDDVDLYSYGSSDIMDTLDKVLGYINRINKK